jgi:hypothetical protein
MAFGRVNAGQQSGKDFGDRFTTARSDQKFANSENFSSPAR